MISTTVSLSLSSLKPPGSMAAWTIQRAELLPAAPRVWSQTESPQQKLSTGHWYMMSTGAQKIDGNQMSLYKFALSVLKFRTLNHRVPIYFLEWVDMMCKCPVFSFSCGYSSVWPQRASNPLWNSCLIMPVCRLPGMRGVELPVRGHWLFRCWPHSTPLLHETRDCTHIFCE